MKIDMENGSEESQLEWAETIERPREEVEFTFTFDLRDEKHVLKIPFHIPLKETIRELMYRIVASHNIPCYLHADLYRDLFTFVVQKQKEFTNSTHTKMYDAIKQDGYREKQLQEWSKVLSKDELAKRRTKSFTVDSAWSGIYHALIHSPALEALLQLEHGYGIAMKDLLKRRDVALQEVTRRHVTEMEEAIAKVGHLTTDEDINRMAARQLEDSQLQEIYWSSAISDLQEKQKREYEEWVLNVHEKDTANVSILNDESSETRTERSASLESYFAATYEPLSPQDVLMEESYTIHLGNQMKTMHNIRLVSRDILDYCQCKSSMIGGNMVPHPQRLQTAMTLYSETLSAMIFLVDDRLNTSIGLQKRFENIVKETTEFHFPNYEKQKCLIEQTLSSRKTRTRTLRTSSLTRKRQAETTNKLLQTGDFYLTKHSNLAEVHAVFHLVTDDNLSTMTINSRHPIMIGVRNIMLTASRYNITNLIIPLLLVHEMGENLTLQWCMKRAELVFKCVKGFMMESLSWDGSESRTLQFVAPPGISEDMFIELSKMLPTIFRESTALNLSKNK